MSKIRRPQPGEPLSLREVQVLSGMGRALSNQQIADELGLTSSTVGCHRLRIFAKLDVHSRKEAVRAGYLTGQLTDVCHACGGEPPTDRTEQAGPAREVWMVERRDDGPWLRAASLRDTRASAVAARNRLRKTYTIPADQLRIVHARTTYSVEVL